MSSEIANKCLIAFNSYKRLDITPFVESFRKKLQNKYDKKIKVEIRQLLEPPGVRGNLPGYLHAHHKLVKQLSKQELKSLHSILYIHDAGLATRMFPLSYETGMPLKSSIRFPQGYAINLILSSIAKSIPLLKGSVIIIPTDQYFVYEKVDTKGLLNSLNNYTMSMLLVPVPIKRVLGSLGAVKLGTNNKIAAFYEKTKNEKAIPKYTRNLTLANTFQVYSTIENLNSLRKALNHFCSRKENKSFVKELNNTDWNFNKLVCETLTLEDKRLNPSQLAMKESLQKYSVTTIGGAVAKGYWEDWSSNVASYLKLFRKLVQEKEKPDKDNNYFIRSKKIKAFGKLKSCIFLDCDTMEICGDYENCIFTNCQYLRLINCEAANNSLFYCLKRLNFFRNRMNNYIYARFLSGRRHIEFESELDADLASSYWIMKKIAEDWLKYHEEIKKTEQL